MAPKNKNIITKADQKKIYRLYTENHLSMKELAEAFNHSVSGIKAIIHNLDSSIYHTRNLLGRNEDYIKDAKNEVWKKLKANTRSRYEVSNYGRIKSFTYNPEGTILKGKMHGGYLMLDYLDLETGTRKHALIHRLVALHFIGKPTKAKPNVIHIDGNKANNRVENLRYANAKETGVHNIVNEDAIALNKIRNTKRTKGAKLTLTQVETIRRILANPNKQVKRSVIAARYNVSEMTIYRIQNGENWGNKGTPLKYTKKAPSLLPNESVNTIRKLLAENKLTQKEIAAKLDTTEVVVSRIKLGKTYKNVSTV
jgi:transposase/predicted DNA-binding protein YlxM (UPF0122 family)